MTSPLSTSLPPTSAAPDASRGEYLHGPQWLGGAEERDPPSPQAIKRRGAAGRGAVPADDAEEHARCQQAADEPDSNEMGMYQDMFDKQVALTISQHQDLGIARLFERQLAGQAGGPARRHAARRRRGRHRSNGAKPSPIRAAAPRRRRPARILQRRLRAAGAADHPPRGRRARASIPLGLLAQAALETGWGQRMPRTADGSSSFNLFGIKAGEEWSGARAAADTVEVSDGVATPRRTAFRAYGSIEESVSDFANLLDELAALSRSGRRGRQCPGVHRRASASPAMPPIRSTRIS